MLRHSLRIAIFCVAALSSAIADDKTTVALTALVPNVDSETSGPRIDALLDLLQVEVSSKPDLSVVERRQISLALHELALSKDLGSNADSRLQLGRIASADLILTLEYKDVAPGIADPETAETQDESPRVLIRIVESLTGVIRGVSVTSIDDERIDLAASHIAEYLAIVSKKSQQPLVTVAVAPFESKGRFDRLRPLERGLRDLITTRLRRLGDVDPVIEEAKNEDQGADGARLPGDKPARGFHVLQRSSMTELLRELELIQSGLVDADRLPATLPTRSASYLLQGTIDETNTDGVFRIVVSSQLVHAASDKAVREFQFEATPQELETKLAHQVDLYAGYLANNSRIGSSTAGSLRDINEVRSNFETVLADLRRFHRLRPFDFSYRDFAIKGRSSGPGIKADSPLGHAVLKKSIDRLETTLFLQPDNMQAAYALGFCLSFQMPGIGQSERADELLRKVGQAATDSALRADALRLLAEISYDHQSGRVKDEDRAKAAEQTAYAMLNIPEEHRDYNWARLTELLSNTLPSSQDKHLVNSVFEFARMQCEVKKSDRGRFSTFAIRVGAILKKLDPTARPEMAVTMAEALQSNDPVMVETAARSLSAEAIGKKDFAAAAEVLITGAKSLEKSDGRVAQSLYRNAATNLRKAGQHQKSIELLESFVPIDSTSLTSGYIAVELGECYMLNGENERALKLLVDAAERCQGLVDNSDAVRLINKLGGVPLREDRDIEVEYLENLTTSESSHRTMIPQVLATDGKQLFCAGGYPGQTSRGVVCYDPNTGTFSELRGEFGRATDMDCRGNELWVATESDGLWKYDLTTSQWASWKTANGLPDNRVSCVVAADNGTYAGVGVAGAGGVVRIDRDGKVSVLDGVDAPNSVPLSMAFSGKTLIVATQPSRHEWDTATSKWTTLATPGLSFFHVFPGQDHAWVSKYRRELAPYNAEKQDAERFRSAWFNGKNHAGYTVHFVVEHRGQVWFGGSPWDRFLSTGFYRIDPKTGEFRMYNQRDGFRGSVAYATFDGALIGDSIWVATSAGLACVTPRSVPVRKDE